MGSERQIISLKFTLTLRGEAGGFTLPKAVKMGVQSKWGSWDRSCGFEAGCLAVCREYGSKRREGPRGYLT